MCLIDEPSPTWSEMEGREARRVISELRAAGKNGEADVIELIDTHARIVTGDKLD